MQLQIDIAFEQLVEIVKKLPPKELLQFKFELEKNNTETSTQSLKELLLKGPTASKSQIEKIVNNRKHINRWRIN